MTIEKRVESLEKRNRKLRKLSLASIAIALAGFVGGTALSVRAWTANIDPASITTQGITLKDANNRVRLAITGADGSVSTYDANGKMRAGLSSSGFVFAYDTNGKMRATLGTNGTVIAYDANGAARVRLNAADNKIYFYNASGGVVSALP